MCSRPDRQQFEVRIKTLQFCRVFFMNYFVYILQSEKDESFYIGYSVNLFCLKPNWYVGNYRPHNNSIFNNSYYSATDFNQN